MTTNCIAEPTLLPNYLNNARKHLGQRFANRQSDQRIAANQLAQFIRSIERLFTAICHGLPQGNLIIKDLLINGDRVVVRYKSQDSPMEEELTGTLAKDKAVAINSLDILNLCDGKVIERRNTVYQIKVD